ncbi:energy transducer TonB [uncultured Psychroserpens sp.]|uniref:energy transducer TonB n=1 Tax=uncultured Psychroserpens sp. TaxID=255436 RepID=UPI00263953D0|nr:energy transducer TonB [uncultured Psychroserpens sp.]
MQVKKNPEIEVARNSSLYFAVGLNLMLLLTYLTFEFKSYKTTVTERDIVQVEDVYEEEIPIIKVKTIPPPAPPLQSGEVVPIVTTSEEINIVDNLFDKEEQTIGSTEVNQEDAVVEYIAKIDEVYVEDVEEDIEIPFAVIENVPIFPGCEKGSKKEQMDCFQKQMKLHVKKHFTYPEDALDAGISGKVHVLFVIDKTGCVAKIRSRGPDELLENEAERIIGLLPQMIPGKQRGRPVSMSYSIPISFVYKKF